MRRTVLALFAVLLSSTLLSAQDSSYEVFAPFVSRLTVTAEPGQFRLSWRNSEDLAGFKRIYRDTREITEATIRNAKEIARVAPEIESYIDTPPDRSTYFYAVLIEDAGGDPYAVLIPYRNKTIQGVRLPQTGPEETAAAVSGITAAPRGAEIAVTFSPSNKTRPLILYRSTSPIRTAEDLARAGYAKALEPGTTSVNDAPVAGLEYYYAVIDASLAGKESITLTPGQNTTAEPAALPLSAALTTRDTARRRTYPLPAPHILYDVSTGNELLPPLPFLLPQEVTLRGQPAERVDRMIERMRLPTRELRPFLLPSEEAANVAGDEKTLQDVVGATLAGADYREAVDRLNEFLRQPHNAKVEARARFYLGQAYFFRGQYRKAMMEFVFAEGEYYPEVQPWIEAALDRMAGAR
ncbi:MAG TPA: hypothetical protein ENN69_05035 [Spirochaetia bacterium]|nr:hypothetical protein [Spirochaetia bacterium]